MGTRFVTDQDLLDQLVYPHVGDPGEAASPALGRLDLASTFGSKFAASVMAAKGAPAYANYDSQVAADRQAVASRPPAQWGSTVYDAWLYALEPVFEPHGTAFPDYMRTDAWAAKDPPGRPRLLHRAEARHDSVCEAARRRGRRRLLEGGAAELGRARIPSPSSASRPAPTCCGAGSRLPRPPDARRRHLAEDGDRAPRLPRRRRPGRAREQAASGGDEQAPSLGRRRAERDLVAHVGALQPEPVDPRPVGRRRRHRHLAPGRARARTPARSTRST